MSMWHIRGSWNDVCCHFALLVLMSPWTCHAWRKHFPALVSKSTCFVCVCVHSITFLRLSFQGWRGVFHVNDSYSVAWCMYVVRRAPSKAGEHLHESRVWGYFAVVPERSARAEWAKTGNRDNIAHMPPFSSRCWRYVPTTTLTRTIVKEVTSHAITENIFSTSDSIWMCRRDHVITST